MRNFESWLNLKVRRRLLKMIHLLKPSSCLQLVLAQVLRQKKRQEVQEGKVHDKTYKIKKESSRTWTR